MTFFKYPICTFLLLMMHINVYGQCGFPANIMVNDDSLSVYAINVSGAIDNDLSSNGICGIRIKFDHDIIGDMSIKLISPAGQVVTLIGPTATLSNTTTFTNWDINFTPCNAPTSPDFGFSPVFDNLQPWGQFGNYSGTYHPALGCLQDFDSGSVNGTWVLEVEDVNRFDIGEIEVFEIFFCDDTGIECEECSAFAADIIAVDTIVCKGDSYLDLDFELIYPFGQSIDFVYKEQFILLKDDVIFDYRSEVNLQFEDAGSYTICHLTYNNDQENLLPPLGTLVSSANLPSIISASEICGSVGNICLEIEIQDPGQSIDVFVEICAGDSIEIFNTFFSEEGVFPISKGGQTCDSIFNINVDVFSPIISFLPEEPELACTSDTITIQANQSESGKVVNYQWSTSNGSIISNTQLSEIEVNQEGTYFVDVIYNDCVVTDTIVVTLSTDIPTIMLRADTLDCKIDAATISISSSEPIFNKVWDGPGIVAEGSLTIKVDEPGEYVLTASDASGCITSASIGVIGDLDPPNINLEVDQIRCVSDSGQVTINGLIASDTFYWTNPLNFGATELNPFITTPGLYYFESIADNGCNRLDSVNIVDDRYTLNLTVEVDTITCDSTRVRPRVDIQNAQDTILYEWKRNGSIFSTNSLPGLSTTGIYDLCLTDGNECSGSSSFEVFENIDPPIVLVEDTIIRCINDSVQIGILNPDPSFTYNWTGPIMFESTDSFPYIFNDGNYTVEVTASTGCKTIENIVVVEGPDLPKSDFIVQTLDCFNDTASILTVEDTGLTYEWTGPGLISGNNDKDAIITEPGFYVVTITKLSDNCRNAYEFNIIDERSYLDVSITNQNLNCKTDTIIPAILLSDVHDFANWEGPENFNVLEPQITLPGAYFVTVTGNNGCETIDSILVQLDDDKPPLQVDSNVIMCIPSEALQVVTSDPDVLINWKLDNVVVGQNDSLMTSIPGVYTIVVEGTNGCVDSLVYEINTDTISPEIDLELDGVISCIDSISLIRSGMLNTDYSYTWSGPKILTTNNNEIEVNGGGVYVLNVQSSNGCTNIDSISVDDDRVESEFILEFENITCNGSGQIAIVDINNTDLITWSGPQVIDDNEISVVIDTEGIYEVVGVSPLGCETSKMVEILTDTLHPQIIASFSDTVTCLNPDIAIGFNIDIDFDSIIWSGAINTSSNDSSLIVQFGGLYNASIVGLNGCTVMESILVEEDTDRPQINILGDSLTCLQSKVLLTLDNYDGLTQVSWMGGGFNEVSDDFFINSPGEYIASATALNGCIGNDTIEIVEDKDIPIISIQDTFYLPCNGDSINLLLDSNDDIEFYRWVGASYFSQDANPKIAAPGLILIFAAGPNGCNTIDSTRVIEDDRAIDFDIAFDTINCIQGFANLEALDVSDDESILWVFPDGATSIMPIEVTTLGGEHKLIVHRSNQCFDSITIDIVVDTIRPQVEVQFLENFQCNNTIVGINSLIVSSAPLFTESWSTNDGNFVDGVAPPVDQVGTYTYTVTNVVNGCSDNESITITAEEQSLLAFDLDIFDPSCLGDENGLIEALGTIGGFGTVIYSLNGNEPSSILYADSLAQGTYNITAVDSFGCVIDTIISIGEGLSYDIELIADTIVELGDSALVEYDTDIEGLSIDSTIWSVNGVVICDNCEDVYFQPAINEFIVLTTVTEEGCVETDSILLIVDSDFEYDFPTIFSPNEDGNNDRYKVPPLKGIEEVVSIKIYDRWGSLVFQEENVLIEDQMGWDGSFLGRQALPAVYAVLLELRLKNNRVVQKVSDITLIR